MQLSVTLNGSETPAELRALALILAAMYGQARVDAHTPESAAAVVIPEAPVIAAGGQEPDPATLFAPDAATVFAPVGNVPGATTAPIAAGPVGTPAAPPPAPAASVAPAGTVELDADGIPWDGRIHASTKTKTAKGVWKALRGLNDEGKVNAIRAELRAALQAPRGTATPPAPAAVPVPPIASAPPVPQPPAAAGTVAVPPAPGTLPSVPGVPPVAATGAPGGDAEAVTTFPQVMKKISSLRVGQFPRMSAEELQAILASVELPSLPSLATRADLIPQVNAQIDALMLTKLQ